MSSHALLDVRQALPRALCIGMLWAENCFVDGKRLMHQCTSNRNIYTIGGDDGNVYFVSVEEYDPATETWMARASVLTARTGLGVVEGGNGKLYAIGGWNNALW